MAIIKIYPIGLSSLLKKLAKYYEIIVYSLLPKSILDQIFESVPDSQYSINHILAYDDIYFRDGYACRDLGILAENRTQNLKPNGEGADIQDSEILVIDRGEGQAVADQKCVTYLQGQVYDGSYNYKNLQYISDIMKMYREGNL